MLTKTLIGNKSDAHDSKESPCFASQLKNCLKMDGVSLALARGFGINILFSIHEDRYVY